MRRIRLICLLTALAMSVLVCSPACALDPSTLCNGSRGDDVRRLQQALIQLGFLSGSADGVFGNKTEEAVRKFQKANHLESDGLAGKKTLAVLYAADQVSASASSAEVSSGPAADSSRSSDSAVAAGSSSSANLFSGNYNVLRLGSTGSRVRILQKALIQLNYLTGSPDGKYGEQTVAAVLSFQRQHNLYQDGVAGKSTLTALEAAVYSGSGNTSPVVETTAAQPSADPAPAAESSSSGSLFSGNYATLRMGSAGSRVRILQQALISLNYLSGTADGKYGSKTFAAVQAFQKQNNLVQDGVAGKKTLTALEEAVKNGAVRTETSSVSSETSVSAQPGSTASETPAASSAASVAKVSAPDSGSIRLLHWFNEIKPTLKNGDHLLIYDPSTGLSWTLRVMSRGRHCDCEPLTQADTDTMVKAFGNKNTWNQKGVYVKLPGGVWTVASTHDMPHMSGSIKDNGFDGHLCVHFLRNMDEAKQNDPNYGVSNQETIRALWKSISGEEITY